MLDTHCINTNLMSEVLPFCNQNIGIPVVMKIIMFIHLSVLSSFVTSLSLSSFCLLPLITSLHSGSLLGEISKCVIIFLMTQIYSLLCATFYFCPKYVIIFMGYALILLVCKFLFHYMFKIPVREVIVQDV